MFIDMCLIPGSVCVPDTPTEPKPDTGSNPPKQTDFMLFGFQISTICTF